MPGAFLDNGRYHRETEQEGVGTGKAPTRDEVPQSKISLGVGASARDGYASEGGGGGGGGVGVEVIWRRRPFSGKHRGCGSARGQKGKGGTGDGGEAWASRQRLPCSSCSPVGFEGCAVC